MKKLTWGILGTGWIANAFVRDLKNLRDHEVLAVGSRELSKAQDFASVFDIPAAYGTYEELVKDPKVDAIYVASPHVYHHDHAILALRAGKHVLVEKPFAMNATEATNMAQEAAKADVLIMEAMWTRFLPHMATVRNLLANVALGDIVSVHADFGIYFDPNPKSRLFDPQLGGGAMLDLGIYPLSFINMVLGNRPLKISVSGQKAFTGVDGQVSCIMDYPGNVQAFFNTTLWASTHSGAIINGTEGRLEIDPLFIAPTSMKLIRRDGSIEIFPNEYDGHGLREQAIEFGKLVKLGKKFSSIIPVSESVRIMEQMDFILKSI